MKKILFALLTLLLAVGLIACGEADVSKVEKGDDSETGDKEKNEEKEKEEEKNEELAVGDTVNFDGMEITLNEVRVEEGGDFDTPQNDKFLVVNMTVENKTDKEQVVSSIMNVELKDDEGYSYNTTILTEGIKGQLDGSVESGGSLRGEIPFDVPESGSYKLYFSDPFKSGKAIWVIPTDKIQ